MRPVHERFLEAISVERERLTSRRRLLSGGAKLAGGGALVAAIGVVPATRSLRLASAQDFTDDLDILNYALTLELLEAAFYRDGLDGFDEDDFADRDNRRGNDEDDQDDQDDQDDDDSDDDDSDDDDSDDDGDDVSLFSRLGEIRDHEQAHVDALTQTITDLGGTPVEEAEYDFGYEDADGFLMVAAALENTGVSAYDGAAAAIENVDLLNAAGSIVAVEARHASYLNLTIGEDPFPAAFETPLTPEEVLEIAGPFIVS